MRIEVCTPDETDRPVIKNLFVFYRYDLMPFIPDGIGSRVNSSGVLGVEETSHESSVDDLDIWWTKPDILMPMLIRADGFPAGLAMVARPPHAHRSVNFRLQDFFILNRWRRKGAGFKAMVEVFRRYPGEWELGWLPQNVAAKKFWRTVTSRLGLETQEWTIAGDPGAPGVPGLRITVGKNHSENNFR